MQGIVKVIASTFAVGGIGVGSYFALTNWETIKGKLESEKFTVLTSSSTTGEWKAVLDKYKVEKTHTFTGKEDKDVDEAYLKKECEKTLSNKSDDTNNYKLAKRWCVKEESIDAILQKRGYTLLENTQTRVEEDKHWESNLTKLKEDTSKFEAFKNKLPSKGGKKEMDLFKEACKELKTNEIKTHDSKFDENIELATKWCSVKKDGK